MLDAEKINKEGYKTLKMGINELELGAVVSQLVNILFRNIHPIVYPLN